MTKPSSSISSDLPGATDRVGVPAGQPSAEGREASAADDRASAAGLFAFQLAGPVPAQVSGRGWIRAMLDAEGALALAEAEAGVIPGTAAEAIEACCRTADFAPDAIASAASDGATGTPVVALVNALAAEVTERFGEEAARYVHFGATSQDIMDTAEMLIARRSLDALAAELLAAGGLAAALAESGRGSLMIGRTLLQAALPTTFGFVAAGWLAGLDRALEGLTRLREDTLAVQLGGAVGTLASLGEDGASVLRRFAIALDLAEPVVPWHAERSRVAELAAALGEVAGVAGKIGLDIVLLAQSEIGEVRERGEGRGGSSAMPQKRNPVAAVAARTAAARATHLVPGLLAGMPELQRGAGTWQSEWTEMSELLAQTGSAVTWIRASLERLEPDAHRMRANLDAAGPVLLAERLAAALVPAVGRAAAQRLVAAAIARSIESGRALQDVLLDDAAVAGHLGGPAIVELLDPATYLGSSAAFIDAAVRAHARAGERAAADERARAAGPGRRAGDAGSLP